MQVVARPIRVARSRDHFYCCGVLPRRFLCPVLVVLAFAGGCGGSTNASDPLPISTRDPVGATDSADSDAADTDGSTSDPAEPEANDTSTDAPESEPAPEPTSTDADQVDPAIMGTSEEVDAVLEDYRLAASAVTASGQPPDPDHAELLARVGDPMLSRVRQIRATARDRGETATGDQERVVRVETLNPVQATVRECMRDGIMRSDAEGGVISPGGTEWTVNIAFLRPTENGWILTERGGDGTPCDPDTFTS